MGEPIEGGEGVKLALVGAVRAEQNVLHDKL